MKKYTIKKEKYSEELNCLVFTSEKIYEEQIEARAIVTKDGVLIDIISPKDYVYKNTTLNEIRNKYVILEGFFYKTKKEFIKTNSLQEKKQFLIELERNIVEDIKRIKNDIIVFVKFIENKSKKDYHLDISLKSSINLAKIHDDLEIVDVNTTEQTSNYFVIIGKLEATQPIIDEFGNQLNIPLSNVPIGILTSKELDFLTNTYERYTKLNIIPVFINDLNDYKSFFAKEYFDKESAEFDYEFLSRFSFIENGVHDFYKDFVLTNERGEFIIHTYKKTDIFLVFEINLLKQGLTKDEIELNFYPYSNFDKKTNLIPSEIPHIFFKAIPINSVDIWNTNEIFDGVYELKIKVNLDLRKWATYIFPPVTYNGKKINDIEFIKEFGVNPVIVKVRDMTKYNSNEIDERYPTKSIQGCIITNLYEYDENQRVYYRDFLHSVFNEFKIFESTHFAIKLPANIYVPFDYHRNEIGEKEERDFRGLWLAAYQIKLFLFNENKYYRTTSTFVWENNNKLYDRDHYHLNLHTTTDNWDKTKQTAFDAFGEGIIPTNKYPYEKAWNYVYPERYRIPSIPKKKIDYEQIMQNDPNFVYSNVFPLYEDGEFIENYSDLFGFGGIGMAFLYGKPIYNSFAKLICLGKDSGIYRWETIKYHTGEISLISNNYLNGYEPKTIFYYSSEVENGERFQRVEAGYAYLLFPNSLPRVYYYVQNKHQAFSINEVNKPSINNENSLQKYNHLTPAQQNISNQPLNYNVNSLKEHYTSYSLQHNSTDICIDLYRDQQKNKPTLIADKLNIYRIVNSKNKLKNYIYSFLNKTYSYIIVPNVYLYPKNIGFLDIVNEKQFYKKVIIKITFINKGEIKQKIFQINNNNEQLIKELDIDEKHTFKTEISLTPYDGAFLQFKLESNSEYNILTNCFTKTKNIIIMDIENITTPKGIIANSPLLIKDNDETTINLNMNADFFKQFGYNIYYMHTLWTNAKIKSYKINSNNGLIENCNNILKYEEVFVNFSGIMINFGKKNGFDFPLIDNDNFLYEPIKEVDYGDGLNQLLQNGFLLFYLTNKYYKKDCALPRYIRVSYKNNLYGLTGFNNYEDINNIYNLSKLIVEP